MADSPSRSPRGATEFLRLPADPELIAAILVNVGDERRELAFDGQAMRDLLAMARQIAPSNASVLITGESGTGKGVVARYVHRHSRRAERPFVSVNCAAAIRKTCLNRKLFGQEKGHFTGATAGQIGKFEEAAARCCSTRSGEMDPSARPSCCVPSRSARSIGSAAPRPVKIDLRLIATSNRDLGAEVAAGRFREDLLFRLNVVNLHLPALRAPARHRTSPPSTPEPTGMPVLR